MLQIIGWLGSFYLVVKGFELYQRGVTSEGEKQNAAGAIGRWAVIMCTIAAIAFVVLINRQADSTPSLHSLPSLP